MENRCIIFRETGSSWHRGSIGVQVFTLPSLRFLDKKSGYVIKQRDFFCIILMQNCPLFFVALQNERKNEKW